MMEFNQSVERFLELVKNFHGASPQFSFDYSNKVIIVVYAPSGFLKNLYNDSKVTASLGKDGIRVVYFAD